MAIENAVDFCFQVLYPQFKIKKGLKYLNSYLNPKLIIKLRKIDVKI